MMRRGARKNFGAQAYPLRNSSAASRRRNSRYVRFGGAYFFLLGAPQTPQGLQPWSWLFDWTRISQRHSGFVQCHCSPAFVNLAPVLPRLQACWECAEKPAKAWVLVSGEGL